MPVNVTPEAIPIGLPVVSPSLDDHVAFAPPETFSAPACADATAARDPHNAESPTFVNLFIVNSFFIVIIHMN